MLIQLVLRSSSRPPNLRRDSDAERVARSRAKVRTFPGADLRADRWDRRACWRDELYPFTSIPRLLCRQVRCLPQRAIPPLPSVRRCTD